MEGSDQILNGMPCEFLPIRGSAINSQEGMFGRPINGN
jgi:hypothetical protein